MNPLIFDSTVSLEYFDGVDQDSYLLAPQRGTLEAEIRFSAEPYRGTTVDWFDLLILL
jgi:hypothetical protein